VRHAFGDIPHGKFSPRHYLILVIGHAYRVAAGAASSIRGKEIFIRGRHNSYIAGTQPGQAERTIASDWRNTCRKLPVFIIVIFFDSKLNIQRRPIPDVPNTPMKIRVVIEDKDGDARPALSSTLEPLR